MCYLTEKLEFFSNILFVLVAIHCRKERWKLKKTYSINSKLNCSKKLGHIITGRKLKTFMSLVNIISVTMMLCANHWHKWKKKKKSSLVLRNVFGLAIYAIVNEFVYNNIMIYGVKCICKITIYSLGSFIYPDCFSTDKVIVC